MHELRIHGRGGQGTVLACKILSKALVEEGKYIAGIPAFGFERRGAPVVAFLRFDDKEIRAVTNIYHPDYVICIDPTVANAVDIFAGITENSTLVQATRKPVDALQVPDAVKTIAVCDAVTLALDVFKRPITNSIMLGAFAKATGLVSLDSIKEGLKTANFRDASLADNEKAAELGFENTKVYHRSNGGWA